jgi:hypothetical protein
MNIKKSYYGLLALLVLLSAYLTSCSSDRLNNNAAALDRPGTQNVSQGSPIVLKRNTSIRGVELYQKTDEVRNWLKQGEYEKIEEFLQKAIADKIFTAGGGFYAEQVITRLFEDSQADKPFDPSWQVYLDRWIEKSPRSSTAYLLRSSFYYNYAWHLRGNRFIHKTPEDARKGFTEKLILSIQDIKQSLSLDSENPVTILRLLEIGNSAKLPKPEFEAFFQKAITLVPYFLEAYSARAMYLTPQWHGSEAELLAFARETAKSAPQGSALPMVIINAHSYLCGYSGLGRKNHYSNPEVWQEIQQNYDRMIREMPESGYFAFQYGQLARDIGREDITQLNYNIAWQREANHPVINKVLAPQLRR